VFGYAQPSIWHWHQHCYRMGGGGTSMSWMKLSMVQTFPAPSPPRHDSPSSKLCTCRDTWWMHGTTSCSVYWPVSLVLPPPPPRLPSSETCRCWYTWYTTMTNFLMSNCSCRQWKQYESTCRPLKVVHPIKSPVKVQQDATRDWPFRCWNWVQHSE